MQFGFRDRLVQREIPSTSLRAGSSLRLKKGYAQDDKVSNNQLRRSEEHS
jgi:hypothetical protein